MHHLNTHQKIAVYAISFMLLAFCGYVGSWHLSQPAPIKMEAKSLKIKRTFPAEEKTEGEPKEILVHISGEVKEPGLYSLETHDRLQDALEIAGGINEHADISKLNLAQKLKDGSKIHVPLKKQPIKLEKPKPKDKKYLPRIAEKTQKIEKSTPIKTYRHSVKSLKARRVINLNSATEDELIQLPGIGPATAKLIIKYRTRNEQISHMDELLMIKGIGRKKLNQIRPYLAL